MRRAASSSPDQGNNPLASTLRCCVKLKWGLFKNWNQWGILLWMNRMEPVVILHCTQMGGSPVAMPSGSIQYLPIHFQDRLNVYVITLHSCGREQLFFCSVVEGTFSFIVKNPPGLIWTSTIWGVFRNLMISWRNFSRAKRTWCTFSRRWKATKQRGRGTGKFWRAFVSWKTRISIGWNSSSC